MLKTIKNIANNIKLLGLGLAVTALTCSQTWAAGNFMDVSKQTSQPIGHIEFCENFKAECSIKTNKPRIVKLTRERWQQLLDVNNLVNMRIEPKTDSDYYKVAEFWTYPSQYGDCEDYVLLKQRELAQLGWPMSSLLITVVRRPDGDGHAVLTVRTDKGDFILDNLEGMIQPWNETVYRYIKRQSAKNTGKWQKIDDNRDQVASIKP